VSGFSRTFAGPPEGGHYTVLEDSLEQFPFVRSVRLQADHHGPAKAGHYVLIESGLGGPAKVRLKPDTTYHTEMETALACGPACGTAEF